MVEFAMTGALLFLFVLVVFDFGMYALAFLSVQNAARAAALRNSGGIESADDHKSACEIVIEEMRSLPNIGTRFSSDCTGAPLMVTAELCEGSASCGGASGTADGEPASAVRVTYTAPAMFLSNGGPKVIAKTVRMKVRNVT